MKGLDASTTDETDMNGRIALFMALNIFFNQKLRKEIQEKYISYCFNYQ